MGGIYASAVDFVVYQWDSIAYENTQIKEKSCWYWMFQLFLQC